MTENLEQLLLRLSKDHMLLNSVEEGTKQGAILPVLSTLGWNCFNIQEVSPEFSVGNGRIDYCLRINQKKAVFIEVKRATENLERHEKQLLEYSFEYGVELAILTNGITWWFYLPLVSGNWQQRKFISIDICNQNIHEVHIHFQNLLSKQSILDGSAVKKAKAIKDSSEKNKLIKTAIPLAWKQLLEEPDEFLLEIFGEKVESICGYIPDLDILTNFIHTNYSIKSLSIPLPSPPHTSTPQKTYIRPEPPPENKKKISSHQKGTSVSIGEKKIIAATVGDLYYQVLKYIFDNKHIEKVKSQIPFATSSVRFLIAKEPVHQRGNSFRAPIEYKGYYMETHKSYEMALKQLEDFLKECGLEIKY